MEALMDYKILTCRGCHNYLSAPLQVCSNQKTHLFCGKCRGKYDDCVICNGKIIDLDERIQEIFLAQMYPCKFHQRGCNEMLPLHTKSSHESECNFKIFKCEYARYTGKTCEWEGPYSEIQHHFRSKHVRFSFSKTPPLSVQMRIPGNSFNFIQMINAYNELFWFKYRIDNEKQKVFFVIQMIGRKSQVSDFSYELEIISLTDPMNAIHFTENCFCDSENIFNIFDSEQCATISFSKIKNFIVGDKLTFNYSIKKKKKIVKGQNPYSNSEKAQEKNNGKKNHYIRQGQRGKRQQRSNSKPRDHSTCSNDPKKELHSDFEVLNFDNLKKQLPSSSKVEKKNLNDNFESVFFDKSSQVVTHSAPSTSQKDNNTVRAYYQQNQCVNSASSTPNNRATTSTNNAQVPFSQSYSTTSMQSNYSNYNPQSSNEKQRKLKKDDNCVIN